MSTTFLFAFLLTAQLGSEDFILREQAQKSLEAMGVFALPALDVAAKSGDMEVAVRSQRIRQVLWLQVIDRRRMPWVDCTPGGFGILSIDHGYLITHYLSLAHLAGHQANGGPNWLDYREAMRMLCRDMIRSDIYLIDVLAMLEVAEEKERRWDGKQYREPEPEPIAAPRGEKPK